MGTETALSKSLSELNLCPNLKVLQQNPQIVELQTIIRDKYELVLRSALLEHCVFILFATIQQKHDEERFQVLRRSSYSVGHRGESKPVAIHELLGGDSDRGDLRWPQVPIG